MIISLNGTDWTLSGWNKYQWLFDKPKESSGLSQPVISKIAATVPGSVQTDLRRANIIQDWNQDLNFFHLEWIEHREWVYEKHFSVSKQNNISKYILTFEGLDFSGCVFLNGVQVLYFDQMHLPYEADVSEQLFFDEVNVLRIVFFQTPELDGQVGYTSRTTVLKSRYNYGWDWMPRMVNIGIFRDVYLRCVESAYLKDVYPNAECDGTNGALTVTSEISSCKDTAMALQYMITYGDEVCYCGVQKISVCSREENTVVFHTKLNNVKIWYPNGCGEQPLYTVSVCLLQNDTIVDNCEKKVGFKKLEYILPEDADRSHYPYSIVVNNCWVPIKGVNWVPVSPFYGSVTEKEYRYYLERFRIMNVNLIRVWGGALLESETFYNLCDEMGFLVWQEFPQSSSGIDNAPCEKPDFISLLTQVAKSYVIRRRHHTSLSIWCAGNELYDAEYHPMTEENPNIAALKQVVDDLDAKHLFLPDSPSGQVAEWSIGKKGTGMCGDTHGPWQYLGPEKHYYQFNEDDSLLHSEVGAPACPRLETLKKHCSDSLWPPSSANSFWRNRGSWWLCDEQIEMLFGKFDGKIKGIAEYVKAFRYMQMEAVRYAASAIRRAGRKKAGIIVWMANEPFPNSANTSILEFDGCPKPVFYKLRNVYGNTFIGLSYSTPALTSGKISKVILFGSSDREMISKNVIVSVFDINGHLLKQYNIGNVSINYSTDIATLQLPIAAPMIIVRITADVGFDFCEEYVFTVDGETPFGALLDIDSTHLDVDRIANHQFLLTNQGKTAALFVDCIGKGSDNQPLVVYNNYRCLLPSESVLLTTDEECSELSVSAMNSSVHTMNVESPKEVETVLRA